MNELWNHRELEDECRSIDECWPHFIPFDSVEYILRVRCGGSPSSLPVGAFESRVAASAASQETRKGIDANLYVATPWRPTHREMFSSGYHRPGDYGECAS